MAPEQHIATNTASGFIGSGWLRLHDAPFSRRATRLDFFNVTPLPDSPGHHAYCSVPTSGADLCDRFLKPVAEIICRRRNAKHKRSDTPGFPHHRL